MRISEFCGLTIRDIDMKERTIDINHQLQRLSDMEYIVRRHIAGGANGILISVYLPSRLCSPGGDRRLLAEWRHAVVALFEEQESCF